MGVVKKAQSQFGAMLKHSIFSKDAAESAVEEETRVPQQSPDASETVDLSHKSPSAETRHMVHSISRPTEGEDQNLRPALTTSMPNP